MKRSLGTMIVCSLVTTPLPEDNRSPALRLHGPLDKGADQHTRVGKANPYPEYVQILTRINHCSFQGGAVPM